MDNGLHQSYFSYYLWFCFYVGVKKIFFSKSVFYSRRCSCQGDQYERWYFQKHSTGCLLLPQWDRVSIFLWLQNNTHLLCMAVSKPLYQDRVPRGGAVVKFTTSRMMSVAAGPGISFHQFSLLRFSSSLVCSLCFPTVSVNEKYWRWTRRHHRTNCFPLLLLGFKVFPVIFILHTLFFFNS